MVKIHSIHSWALNLLELRRIQCNGIPLFLNNSQIFCQSKQFLGMFFLRIVLIREKRQAEKLNWKWNQLFFKFQYIPPKKKYYISSYCYWITAYTYQVHIFITIFLCLSHWISNIMKRLLIDREGFSNQVLSIQAIIFWIVWFARIIIGSLWFPIYLLR